MKFRYSAKAEADIDSLEFWIASEGSPNNAIRYVNRLDAAIAELVYFPNRCPELPGFSGHRVFTFERRLRVIYRIGDDLLSFVRVFGPGQLIAF